MESLEREMQLLGLTGVEDRLQADVRPTLELLRNAGIKVPPRTPAARGRPHPRPERFLARAQCPRTHVPPGAARGPKLSDRLGQELLQRRLGVRGPGHAGQGLGGGGGGRGRRSSEEVRVHRPGAE